MLFLLLTFSRVLLWLAHVHAHTQNTCTQRIAGPSVEICHRGREKIKYILESSALDLGADQDDRGVVRSSLLERTESLLDLLEEWTCSRKTKSAISCLHPNIK